ncbi:helix-turn-helix domain-containing protein [Desulfobaculum sp. SPO524]|uniref:helix-turn-helix domain-containing protein n=1 Tax=Desulfobaculum sp. SPO524 TaxID=3378071 RepID=UPI0038520431
MNLQELGDLFRQERERQGLTIDEVVEKTKISKINIEAIETANPDLLPHPVYAKGFVRNYARLLGLDVERLAGVMAVEYPVESDAPGEELDSEPAMRAASEALDNENRRKTNLMVFIAAIVVILAGFGGYMAYDKLVAKKAPAEPVQQEEAAPAEVEQPTPLDQLAEESVKEAQPEAVAEPAAEEAATAEPEAEDAAPAQAEEAPAQDAAATPAAPAAPAQSAPEQTEAAPVASEQPAQVAEARQRVEIVAKDVCWLLAKVDGGEENGGVTVDVTLRPGQQKLLRFAENMTVKLGNAGGVTVTLNGAPYDFKGEPGQVRTLRFTAE